MFTFVVTCYQQAELIKLALESVKYQIKQYGQNHKFQLIVTDDGSTDSSQEVIRHWVRKNENIFVKISLLFKTKNVGICKVYADAMMLVEGEQFAVLNGDDMLTPYNIFLFAERLKKYDIVATAFLKFTGYGKVIRTYRTYTEVVLQQFIKGKTLHCAVRLGCPIMGVAMFRRSLLTKDVFDFILQFKSVNDRACFQKIFEIHDTVNVCYVNCPMVLYRVTPNSLSNFGSSNRILHNTEIGQLCHVQLDTEKSRFFRLLLLWQERAARFRQSDDRCIRMLRFFSPYFAIMLWLYVRHFKEIRNMERHLVEQYWKDCEAHYREIEFRAVGGAYKGRNIDDI